MNISLRGQVVDDVPPGSWEQLPGVSGLHRDDLDVHQVPGDCLQHQQLRALNVQTEVVDGDIAGGRPEEAVQREALDLMRRLGRVSKIFDQLMKKKIVPRLAPKTLKHIETVK